MSKMDNLRAMREAKYAAAQALPKSSSATTSSKAPRPAAKTAKTAPTPMSDEAPATEELCGHKNMSGRTCTREKGHSAKSHRYS